MPSRSASSRATYRLPERAMPAVGLRDQDDVGLGPGQQVDPVLQPPPPLQVRGHDPQPPPKLRQLVRLGVTNDARSAPERPRDVEAAGVGHGLAVVGAGLGQDRVAEVVDDGR